MERGQEPIEASLHVVGMYAFDPSCAHFLLHGSASELEPWLIEIIAKAIRSGEPNHHRRRIGHLLEPSLTLAQPLFSAFEFSDFVLGAFQVFDVDIATVPATIS